ncbi:hypothetical protein A2U01_0088723, partial [Trifolium medium]|nr:hypothetical protein [Trifolium medium]
MDSHFFNDGSSVAKSRSAMEDDGVNGSYDGSEEKNDTDWNEGWPEENSGGQNQNGYYLQDNICVV